MGKKGCKIDHKKKYPLLGKKGWKIDQKRKRNVPVRKVKGGYRWGKSGKTYKTKKAAERQGRAIYASGYGKKRGRKKKR